MKEIEIRTPNLLWEEYGFSYELFMDEQGKPVGFEVFDAENGPEHYHAEGRLEWEGNNLVGYDGVMDLDERIQNKIEELGFRIDL